MIEYGILCDLRKIGGCLMRSMLRCGMILFLLFVLLVPLAVLSASAEGAGEVEGIVWLDRTLDGLFVDERGIEDVKLTLQKRTDSDKPAIAGTKSTNKDGYFRFNGLEDGEYRLVIELPKNCSFTIHGLDSQALPAQGRFSYTDYFTVSGGKVQTVNVGATFGHCSASFVAFEDENLNGGRMSTETLIRNVLVDLIYVYDGQEYVVASELTNKQGEAAFLDLTPGTTYYARATLHDNLVIGPMGDKVNTYYNCFHPNEGGGGYSDPFNLEAKESIGMGIGLVRTGSLTGSVWYDENNNGSWDDQEGGLTDAVVTLHSISLGMSRQTHPDENGYYEFTGLQPGDYKLEFTLPEGMIFTWPGQSLLSDIASKGSFGVSVQVDVTTPISPVGAMPACSLSLALYEDQNLNGAWDDQEPGIPGASVTASQGGKALETLISDTEGRIRFAALRSGDAVLSVTLPDGFILYPDESALFTVSGALTNAETTVTLSADEELPLLSAAVIQASAIRGVMFEDPVNQGLYQEDYPLLSGFTVQAVDEDGVVVATAATQDGAYTLYPLLPGFYTVRFLLNDPYVAAPYAADQSYTGSSIMTQNPDYGETEPISLEPGQLVSDVNGAVFRAGTVDGVVGLEGTEGGLSGVTVTLLDLEGQPVSDFSYGVTDDTGAFLIKGVLPDIYQLCYELPENGAFTQPMTEEMAYYSETFTTESGSEIHMPALYGVYTSELSGAVTVDAADARPVILTLTSGATGEVLTQEVRSGETYRFAHLRPGTYTVKVDLPEDLVFGESAGGLFSMIADHTAEAELDFPMGENRLNADLRAAVPVDLSGILYLDADRSATLGDEESGAEGRTLMLSGNGLSFTETTDGQGRFVFTQLPPGEYALSVPLDDNEILVGVAHEPDQPWELSVQAEAGVQIEIPLLQYARIEGKIWNMDGSENQVGSISLVLSDETGAQLDVQETDEHGDFAFDGLMPGGYTLAAKLPEGYLFARSQDAVARPSYIQSQTDGTFVSLPFDVAMGDTVTGIDIGMGAMGQLGDRAWLDTNGNGLQDLGEPDMPGIVIELYQYGEFAGSAVTDVYGRYLFTDLYPGEYEMRITMHKELKPTVQVDDFPLLNSVMPEQTGETVVVQGVVVPSGTHNLHCDLGFQLVKKGVYPAAMDDIPVKDWRPYNQR